MAKKKPVVPTTKEDFKVEDVAVDDNSAASVTDSVTVFRDLLAPLFAMVNGLELGMNNLLRVVTEPREMHGAPLALGVMTLGWDGKSVELNAPKMKKILIPFTAFAAMVERLHDPDFSSVEIQAAAAGDKRYPAKSEILGLINPFYSQITIYMGTPGERLRPDIQADKILRFYISRHGLATCYLAAKFQVYSLRQLEEIQTQVAGWQKFAVPYAIDSLHNKSHLEALSE